jgi:uncharacterized membrane protein
MPAVIIRMLDSLTAIVEQTTSEAQRRSLVRQAEMIMRSAEASVTEPDDLEDIRARYRRMTQSAAASDPAAAAAPVAVGDPAGEERATPAS